ncbi:MAG: hypothetical protein DPW09_22245 [Anaerolineae bacterium]|nr:hypothetical protein [Anaerolineae bacterium]
MLGPTYLSIEEATRKYGVEKKVLTQLIEAGMIETRETPTGEMLVVADKNGNGHKPQTKEEIIAAKFAHLREQPISASEASRKYSKIHGVPISNQLFSRWGQLGHITVLERGYRLQLDEADVAYCAEIYAQKYKEYNGRMSGVRIFDDEGNPYQLKYPEVAEQLREERRLARQVA